MVPEGLGAGARRGRELAHKRPPGGAAYENRAEKAGVHGRGVPCGEGDSGALVPAKDGDDHDSSSSNRHENSEKSGQGRPRRGPSPSRHTIE